MVSEPKTTTPIQSESYPLSRALSSWPISAPLHRRLIFTVSRLIPFQLIIYFKGVRAGEPVILKMCPWTYLGVSDQSPTPTTPKSDLEPPAFISRLPIFDNRFQTPTDCQDYSVHINTGSSSYSTL